MNVLAIALLAATVSVGSPYLVTDFDRTPQAMPVQPAATTAVGDVFFFPGTDAALWRSDGTASGTWRVADDVPGRHLRRSWLQPVVAQGAVFYAVETDQASFLYRTDGTTPGTHRLGQLPAPIEKMAACGRGKVCFASGGELGVSDGTAEGTFILPLASPKPTQLTPLNQRLFFAGRGGLWVSDGTTEGTRLVKRIESISPGFMGAGARKVFFLIRDDIWASDGTEEGTEIVAPHACLGACVPQFVAFRGQTYIAGIGERVLRSDGTRAGTAPVEGMPEFCVACGFRTFSLMPAGETLLLHLSDTEGRTFMWSFDGEHAPAEAGSGRTLLGYLPAVKRWYYTVGTGELRPKQLWSFDGTKNQKILAFPSGRGPIHAWGAAQSQIGLSFEGRQWIFDANTNGLRELAINRTTASRSDVFGLLATEDRLYFGTYRNGHGSLHVTDGTAAGTVALGPADPFGDFLSDSGRIYYSASFRLWMTDGTRGGTRSLADTFGIYSLSPPIFAGETPVTVHGQQLVRHTGKDAWEVFFTARSMFGHRSIGDRMLFWAGEGIFSRWTLHVSDATRSGTYALPLETHRFGDEFLVDGNRAFFARTAADGVQALWVSDGTAGGTREVHRFDGASGDVIPDVMWTGVVYFRVTPAPYNGGLGELWRSDGTTAGTYRLSTATFTRVMLAGDRLVLVNTHGPQVDIWTSDGTPGGTRRHRQANVRLASRPFPLPNGGVGIALFAPLPQPHIGPAPSPSTFEIYDITSDTSTQVSLGRIRIWHPDSRDPIHYANGRLYFDGFGMGGDGVWAVPLSGGRSDERTDVEITDAHVTRWKNGWAAVFRVKSDPHGATIPVVLAETVAGTLREDIDYPRVRSTLRFESFAEGTVVVPVREGAGGTVSIALTAVSGARIVRGFATVTIPDATSRPVSH